MKNAEDMRLLTLSRRDEKAEKGTEIIDKRVGLAAYNGDFEVAIYTDESGDEIVIPAAALKKLKEDGYKVKLFNNDGWDNLHRYYKGALKISWKR